MSKKTIRIGGASGAWGDSPMAFGQLLGAGVDYLMMDYLAEVSMSLLARARMKDPNGGYPPDSVVYLKAVLPDLAAKGVRVTTNAGGVNPAGCKRALEAAIAELGRPLLVGSSLGGYYATCLAERHGLKALLVNPAVAPHRMFDGYLGPQQNLYSGETWDLTLDHVTALAELEVPAPQDPQRFQVWLQTADETLDYRAAQQYYRACALRIQAGGDHSFQGFAEQLQALLSFAGIAADTYQAIDFSQL